MTDHDVKHLFVTVGTDVHPFNRLTRWVDAWLEAGAAERVRCFMQTGTSDKPRLADHSQYLTYREMTHRIQTASTIISHGGPATIMQCASMGKRPIVVPRSAQHGEHVDDHQRVFTSRLAAGGVILLAETEDQFRMLANAAIDGHAANSNGAASDPVATAAVFEELVNGLFSEL